MGQIVSSVVYYCDLTLSVIADTHTSVGRLMVVLFGFYALGLQMEMRQSPAGLTCVMFSVIAYKYSVAIGQYD